MFSHTTYHVTFCIYCLGWYRQPVALHNETVFLGEVDVAVILHVFYSIGGQEREECNVIVRAVVLKEDLGFQK